MILLACLCCMLFSCENVEKKALERLQTAREAFERGDFSEAKMQIDSIKILYPKAFETRREGISLMQQVELKEQEKTLVYLDSLLQKKQSELDAIKGKFTFEKDAEYQKTGNYLHPSQVIEKNMHRSYLRFQVNETGQMSMTSIYCGPTNIHHIRAIRSFSLITKETSLNKVVPPTYPRQDFSTQRQRYRLPATTPDDGRRTNRISGNRTSFLTSA